MARVTDLVSVFNSDFPLPFLSNQPETFTPLLGREGQNKHGMVSLSSILM